MFGFGDNPWKVIGTALAGLVAAGVVASIYVATDWISPAASPYAFTIIVGAIAALVWGASWLIWTGWIRLRAQRERNNVRKATGDRLSIVVAALKDDDGDKIAERVVLSLRSELGDRVEVIPVDAIIARGKRGNEDARESEARKAGQALLAQAGADVLIWGSALRQERVVDLNFLAQEASGGLDGTKSYALSQTMRLPLEFGRDLGAAIAGAAASAATPAISGTGQYLVAVLLPVVEKLRRLAENPPQSLDASSRAEILHAYALANDGIGEQTGSSQYLKAAIAAYDAILPIWTRNGAPLRWAIVQHNRGASLQSLGEMEKDNLSLEKAIEAFANASSEISRERFAYRWATTQVNLGNTYRKLGNRLRDPALLERAIQTHRNALQERRRDRWPVEWATSLNNLGTALGNLGEMTRDTGLLQQALAVFEDALKERSRQNSPLRWAATRANMGSAFIGLGSITGDLTMLRNAVQAYRDALQEWTLDRMPVKWAMVQSNLGKALLAIGNLGGDEAPIKEAVCALAIALVELKKQGSDYQAAQVQKNLEIAEKILAKIRNAPP